MNDGSADVIIIGGGIVGCATAYYLSKRDIRVILIEKGDIGEEQSSRNWGFVRQQRRDPAELPLMMESNKIWQGLEDELDADIEWIQGGVLALADDEATMAWFREWVDTSKEHGLETNIVSRADVLEMAPKLTGSYIGGIYTPSDGHADPAKSTQAFATAAERNGAIICTYHIAEQIDLAGGRVDSVVTDRGVFRAPVIVNAAGARASKIARMVGLSFPQLLVRSTVAETTEMSSVTRAGVWAPNVSFRQKRDGRFYIARGGQSDYDISLDSIRYIRHFMPNYLKNRRLFRMRLGRQLLHDIAALFPGTEARRLPFLGTVGLEPRPNYRSAMNSLNALQRLIPEAGEVRIRRTWAGLIDTTPDALPVIGEAHGPTGFVFATGFSGHGFGIGPIAGRLVAELIEDGKPSQDLRAFAFDRFAARRTGKARRVA